MFLSCETCKDIGLRTVGEGYKRISLVKADFSKQFRITGIAMDDFTVRAFVGELMAAPEVRVDDAEFIFVIGHVGQTHCNLAGTHDEHTTDAMAHIAGQVEQVMDMVARSGYIKYVILLNEIVAARYNGLVVTLATMSKKLKELGSEHVLVEETNQPHCFVGEERTNPVAKAAFDKLMAFMNEKTK